MSQNNQNSHEFRLGILYGLASKGVTPEELGEGLLEKQAAGLIDAAKGAVNLIDWGTAAAVGVPLAAGVAGGGLAYGLTRPDYHADIKDAQREQMLNVLRRYTRDAKRRTTRKQPNQLLEQPV